jgi:hypothetical protein
MFSGRSLRFFAPGPDSDSDPQSDERPAASSSEQKVDPEPTSGESDFESVPEGHTPERIVEEHHIETNDPLSASVTFRGTIYAEPRPEPPPHTPLDNLIDQIFNLNRINMTTPTPTKEVNLNKPETFNGD